MDDNTMELQAELARVDAALAALAEECARTGGSATNPEGEIGGIRSRSRRQKARLWDRWDRQAGEWQRLTRRRRELATRIKAAEDAPKRAAAADAVEDLCRRLAPGDRVWAGYPEPCTVVRVNARTITVRTPGGRLERAAFCDCGPVMAP